MAMARLKMMVVPFLVAVAFGAVGLASASAAEAGWMVNATLLKGTAAVGATAKVEQFSKLTSSGLTIECTGSTLNGVAGRIESPNKASVTTLEFTGCGTVPSTVCQLEGTTIRTVPISVSNTLEGTLGIKATLKPAIGSIFTTLKFLGSECSFASEVEPVEGDVGVTDASGQDEAVGQLGTTNVTEAEKLLKMGESNASIKGKVVGQLAEGQKWSFL
jgi:hypothetical protein